jgi:purine-binding chemotaxis protein CheW
MERLDFLCVSAGAQRIAIPLSLVLSVEEAGPLTPLPFSPALVEGLVMALGRVLPQMSLTEVLGEGKRDGGVLVVAVAASDDVRALRVDQVAGMVQVDVQMVRTLDDDERAARPLVTARFEALGNEWCVLDYVKLTSDQPMEAAGMANGAAMVAAAGPDEPGEGSSPPDDVNEHLPLLVVEIAGETYALPTSDIVELLVPGVVRSMPGAPAWVAGLVDRRGAPLLALATAALLGRPSTSHSGIALVVDVAGVGEVGIMVERAVGIERVHHSAIHAVPQDMAGVGNYFVIATEHIVGIISPAALTAQVSEAIAALVPRLVSSPSTAEVVAADDKASHKLLSVRVGRELFALPLERVERIEASVVLTPLPRPGTGFHGLADVGDATVPVFDLRQQIEQGGSDPNPPCTLVEIEGGLVGLAVDQVLRIEDVPDSAVEDIATSPMLAVSHVAHAGDRLLSVLVIDRVLPPLERAAISEISR